jgi:hypothetical protein
MHEPPSYQLKVQRIFEEAFGPSAGSKVTLGLDGSLTEHVARSYPGLSAEAALDLAFHLSDCAQTPRSCSLSTSVLKRSRRRK